MLPSSIERLRAIGFLEGASFLLLLGVAMPLKYLAGLPAAVRYVGWAHGVLFILFVLAVLEVSQTLGWRWRRVLAALVAAVLPFGTFVLDARLLRAEAARLKAGAPARG